MRGDLLGRRAAATPTRTALVDPEADVPSDFAALDRAVDDRVRRLGAAGVDPGDHVGLIASTSAEAVRAVHAVWRRGARLVGLDARLAPAELAERLDRADVDVLLCDHQGVPTAERTGFGSVYSIDGSAGVPALAGLDGPSIEAYEWRPPETAALLFTSGSTGRPKPVVLTWSNLLSSAVASSFRLGVLPGDRWSDPLPIYHMGGLAPVVRTALAGTTLVVHRDFDAAAVGRALDEHGVTGISLVPTMLKRLLEAGPVPGSLRFVLLGGAPTPAELVAECRDRGVPVFPSYGLTETASQVATATPEEAFADPGTVGRPLIGTRLGIVDPAGDRLPPDETGEIVVDGPTVSPGYYNEASDRFTPEGFRTGDLGVLDGSGRLRVTGRVDDRIITGGETVQPGEVRAVLESFPGVEEAAVVGLEDDEWGEVVAALVVPAGGEPLDRGALEAHCRERLAGYKLPKVIRSAETLPRTGSGTVDRPAVRAALGAG